MNAQIDDGEDGVDENDGNRLITTQVFFKLKSENHSHLSGSFVVLQITRMQQYV